MRNLFSSILNPAGYHGHAKRPPFFEGWYFKLVDASERHRYAVIPGIFLSDDPEKHHAFIQLLDGRTGRADYHRFPPGEFWAAKNGELDLCIGPNRFTVQEMVLDIPADNRPVRGRLRFPVVTPWPITWASPGIMGWYAWVPFMETYHGVPSLDHPIEGALEIAGHTIDFSGGRGYIEKDWGRSFPAAWVWFQTNHFDRPGTSLTASVAIIPWVGRAFPGFIIGLWYEGKLSRFATYTGARIKELDIGDRQIYWVVEDRAHRLEMIAVRAEGSLLRAPSTVDMGRRISETLNATVDVKLVSRRDQSVLFVGTGRHAGLEAVGDLDQLVRMWATRR
jgi:hypothetical protein